MGKLGADALPTGVSQSTTLLVFSALFFFPPFTNATSAVTVTSCAQAKTLKIISTQRLPTVAVFLIKIKYP
jgi:hypothetical protein